MARGRARRAAGMGARRVPVRGAAPGASRHVIGGWFSARLGRRRRCSSALDARVAQRLVLLGWGQQGGRFDSHREQEEESAGEKEKTERSVIFV